MPGLNKWMNKPLASHHNLNRGGFFWQTSRFLSPIKVNFMFILTYFELYLVNAREPPRGMLKTQTIFKWRRLAHPLKRTLSLPKGSSLSQVISEKSFSISVDSFMHFAQRVCPKGWGCEIFSRHCETWRPLLKFKRMKIGTGGNNRELAT